jgi:hypothetical protein
MTAKACFLVDAVSGCGGYQPISIGIRRKKEIRMIALPEIKSVEPVWVKGLSNEAYHKKTEFMSATGCKRLLRSAEYFMDCLVDPPEPTDAMEFGTLIHEAVLEGELFYANTVKLGEMDRRTKAGKALYEEIYSSLKPGQRVLEAKKFEAIERILEKISKHPIAKGMLVGGDKEISGFATEPTHGIASKIRPDLLLKNDGIILDVKTTADASKEGFEKQIWNLQYHLAAYKYLYIAGLIEKRPFDAFFYLAIENKRPYSVALYRADDAQLEVGEYHYRKALKKYVSALEKNEWIGYQTESEWIGLPDWALHRVEMERKLEA